MDSFLRVEMLLGKAAMERLRGSSVAVVGVGGVGSFAAEGLARCGVGRILLMDHDVISESNINRQLMATVKTVGQTKSECMAARVREINPDCDAVSLPTRYTAETRETLFSEELSYILDCIDIVSCKLDLIETALIRGIPILSALGTGNKLDAGQLCLSDISETENCPLARVIRKELRARGIRRHQVLWSREDKRMPDALETPPPGRRSVPASVVWVPGCAGLRMAGEAVRVLCEG